MRQGGLASLFLRGGCSRINLARLIAQKSLQHYLPLPDSRSAVNSVAIQLGPSGRERRRASSASSSDRIRGLDPCLIRNPFTDELDRSPANRFPAEKVFSSTTCRP